MKKLTVLTVSFLSVLALAILLFYTSCTKDKCKGITCQNGGTCVNGSCDCPAGYEGTNCQTLSSAKYEGTWNVKDTGSWSGSNAYTVTVVIGSSGINSLIINGFYGNLFNNGVNATFSGLNITIPTQAEVVDGFGAQVWGQGTISSDGKTINLNYTATGAGLTDNVTSVWTR